jgi:WD40 repeat protein
MEESIRDFFDWRLHAPEFYSSITMHALSVHPISVHFTRQTVLSGDSAVFGAILGIPGPPSTITLYNCLFPNRHSLSFAKSRPNPAWGKVTPIRAIPMPGRLLACSVHQNNDILAATEFGLHYFGESAESTIVVPGRSPVSLIQCSPVDLSGEAFFSCESGEVFHLSGDKAVRTGQFQRQIIDLTIDPFQPASAIVTQGKTHVHLIDTRASAPIAIKLTGHTSALSFAPEIPFLFATGQCSGVVALFDMRYPSNALADLQGHDSQVIGLKWSPHYKDVVASSSVDTSLALWSVKRTDHEWAPIFTHDGHVAPIVAFDWCKDVPWTMASLSEDNMFEMWTIASSELEDYLYPE